MKARPAVGAGAGVADKAFRKGANQFASNNWAISGRLTESGFGIFANDPHLPLINPTTLYPIHADNKTFSGGRFNFSGFTFPGIPSVLIGQNERLAWGATIALYDVTSVYLEEVTSGPGGKTVRFRGEDVPILTVPAVFKIRGKADRVVPIDVVPHHGPQVPDPDPKDGVAGIEATGMSLRWTGHEPSLETKAFRSLVLAESADEFMDAMAFFGVGAQNFLSTDADGVVAYSPHAYIPVLTPGARSEATPPYVVQPGDGSAEWDTNPDGSPKWVPDERIPQAKDPAAGFLVTTNNDITGVAQDGNPLNDDLYLYARIADGVRAGQALAELTAEPEGGWTPEQSMG
ncbi:MAG: penicillin acylase family protein, partial [Candidatus Methylomirabilis sp.]|nr:penicillin acylase family protein [Deltaproteobacteria bacterium]